MDDEQNRLITGICNSNLKMLSMQFEDNCFMMWQPSELRLHWQWPWVAWRLQRCLGSDVDISNFNSSCGKSETGKTIKCILGTLMYHRLYSTMIKCKEHQRVSQHHKLFVKVCCADIKASCISALQQRIGSSSEDKRLSWWTKISISNCLMQIDCCLKDALWVCFTASSH